MMWGAYHWVGLCINLLTAKVTILDSYILHSGTIEEVDAHMAPLISSLAYILEQYVGKTGDCGTFAAKFIEMHANGDGKEEMSQITDKIIDRFREKYAMDCYEEFVGDFRVANEGLMKLGTDEQGMSYYECKEFEDDGFHIRHRCFNAIEEELEELKEEVVDQAKSRMKMEDEIKEVREEINLLKESVKCPWTNVFVGKTNQGDTSVREYNTKFLGGGLLDKHDEATWIKMYRDGLREDIRSGIGTTVFSTIDEIMQAALDVEEGESPCDSNGSDTESDDSGSDESGRRPNKKARTEKNHNDNREDEDHDVEQENETSADTENEWSLPDPVEGSDDESDRKVDLKDYQ
uniref:Ubiquitin-like protease family profile domain-containing protein n=1 Tax=Brassica oleracea var. oleracea TaxID=109376 RepID=A0A0D3BGU7_BRAOL